MNKTMKRILGAALAVFLGAMIATAVLPEGARAASSHSNHRLCNETICPHDGEHTSITSWTAWNSSTSLPDKAGNYYLTKNVTLANPITLSKDMVLCLNGNTITYTGTGSSAKDADYGIHVRAANVRICNCHEEGGFTMPSDIVNDPVESLIYVQANATDAKGSQLDLFNVNIKNLKSDAIHLGTGTASHMNIYGGEISGCTVFRGAMFLSGNGPAQVHLYGDFKIANNTASEYAYNNAAGILLSGASNLYMHDNTAVTGNYTNAIGGIGGIAVHGQGSLYMYDNASVTNNRGHINGVGGVDVNAYYNYFYVKDNVRITGNTAGSSKASNVNLVSYNTPIILYNKLTSNASIGVTMETPSTFTSGWTSRMGAVDPAYFFSDSNKYEVIKSGNELALTAHTHDYTYTASGAKITESCTCGQTGSVTIVKPANNTAAATLTKTGTLSTTPTIYYGGYAGTDYPLSTTVPTAAGEYYAQITMGDKTVHVDFTRTHSHAVCSDSTCACGEGHASVIWKPWESSTTLPTSRDASNTNSNTNTYYYLTQDVVLTTPWVNNLGIDLCLNGHTITYALTTNEKNSNAYDGGLNILAASGSYFDGVVLTNCQDLGGITMASSITPCTDSLVFVDSKPSSGGSSSTIIADFYNIKISGSKCNALRVGDSTNDYILLGLHDTQICDNTSVDSAAVEVYTINTSNYGLTLNGDSAIKNNTASGNAKAGGLSISGRTYVRLYDDSVIANNSSPNAGGVYLASSGSTFSSYLHLYENASVKNNSGATGGVHVSGNTYLYLHDNASVSGNVGTNAGGIYVPQKGYLYAYGSAQVTDNTVNSAANNVCLSSKAVIRMMSSSKLTEDFAIGVTMANPDVFTVDWTNTMADADYNLYYTSDDSNYTISKDGDELTLLAVPKEAEVTTWPTASELTYGNKLSASTLAGGAASVEGTFAWTTPDTIPSAGTAEYSVTFTPTDSAYAPVVGKIPVNVAKADPVVTWPTAYNINYNTLLKDVVLDGGEASVEGSFAWKNPNTLPPAGTASYPMVFTPADTDNYNTVEGQVSVKVHKLPSSVMTNPTASDITYGDSLADSVLSGGIGNYAGDFAWEDPTIVPEVGTHTYTVIFTPENPSYEPSSTTVTVKVNPAATDITSTPTASDITEGQSLADSVLSGGKADVEGTFAWADPDTVPTVGTHEYDVIFTPENGNYEQVTIKVSITVTCNHVFTERIEDAAHFVEGTGANCQDAKRYYYDCTKCDAIGEKTFESDTFGPHSMSTEWTTADEQHYHACTVNGCDYKEDLEDCHGGTASCTAKAVCIDCGEAYGKLAEHDFTERIEDAAHLVEGSGADCQDAKEFYFDCANCDAIGTETFESGAGDHAPAQKPVSNDDGTHTTYCAVDGCGESLSTDNCKGNAATCEDASICSACGYTIQNKLGHDMGDPVSDGASGHSAQCSRCNYSETDVHDMPSTWTRVDDTTHTRACKDACGYSETATHAGGNATCSQKAVCTDCQSEYGATLPHDWEEEYSHDENGHWHDCEDCNATDGAKPHNPGPEATEESAQVCLDCGRVLTPALEHKHAPTYVEAEAPTCTKDGTIAHYVCKCGTLFADAEGNTIITNIIDPMLEHDMPETWTCDDSQTHSRACARGCGHTETQNHSMPENWSYVDETTHKRTCTADGCTYTETESHAGGNATCDDAPICDDCGKAYGEGHGHDMNGVWTYKDDQTHELTCAHGCGHTLTEPHSMSDWAYNDENTHSRTCNVTNFSRAMNHTCGWEQLEDHYDNNGDSLCDVCGGELTGGGIGGDGEDDTDNKDEDQNEDGKGDNPDTGNGSNFVLLIAIALLALGAIGAGAKFIWARKRHFI